jgi:beta-glucanase (GH16 family)
MKTIITTLLLLACLVGLTQTNPPASLPPAGYHLVWADEFDGSALDTNQWDYRTDSKMWSTQLPANVSVHDGQLVLAVKRETAGSKHYTGAGIISKRTFKYGYYESRFKVPPGAGWHTSFWMMRHNGKGGTGPTVSAQELDVCENDSVHQDGYSVNVHKWNPLPHVAMGTKYVKTPSLSAEFHVYGCEFSPRQVKYFFDGRLVQTVDVSHFQHSEQNIWLTTIASSLGGTKAVDDHQLPSAAVYDYVRFYEKITN